MPRTWRLGVTAPHCSLLWYFVCVRNFVVEHHFYPRPDLGFGYCRCLRLCVCVSVCPCVCINHLLVRAITPNPFKLGSPNVDHRCKTPWKRSLLFLGGASTLTFKVKFNLKVKIYPILSLSATITHHPFKLGPPNLAQRCKKCDCLCDCNWHIGTIKWETKIDILGWRDRGSNSRPLASRAGALSITLHLIQFIRWFHKNFI